MRDEAVTRCTTGGRCARCEPVDLKCLLRNNHKRAMFMTVFGNSTCYPNIAFSHTHGDHFGANPSKFGFDPSTYEKLRANPVVKLNGDYDVFGDGSVMILSTPGHTPGHQSLLVLLPKSGPVLLSGDAVHFRDNWENRRVPSMNVNREQTLASMQRIAGVMETRKAQLWINHDKDQSAQLRYAPAYYE